MKSQNVKPVERGKSVENVGLTSTSTASSSSFSLSSADLLIIMNVVLFVCIVAWGLYCLYFTSTSNPFRFITAPCDCGDYFINQRSIKATDQGTVSKTSIDALKGSASPKPASIPSTPPNTQTPGPEPTKIKQEPVAETAREASKTPKPTPTLPIDNPKKQDRREPPPPQEPAKTAAPATKLPISTPKSTPIPEATPANYEDEEPKEYDPRIKQMVKEANDIYYSRNYPLAIEKYKEIIAIEPRHAPSLHWMGLAQFQTGQYKEGLANVKLASECDRTSANILSDLGIMHEQLPGNQWEKREHFLQALEYYKRSAALDPSRVAPYLNAAKVYQKEENYGKALENIKHAIRLYPNDPAINNVYGACLLETFGSLDDALIALGKDVQAYHLRLVALHYADNVNPAQLYNEHVRWGLKSNNELTQKGSRMNPPVTYPITQFQNSKSPKKQLNIAYVSSAFSSNYIIQFGGAIREHDPEKFQVYFYQTGADSAATNVWKSHSIGKYYQVHPGTVAEHLIRDQIDIAVDLDVHSNNAAHIGAFLQRSAPIQINWLGYIDTAGVEQYDYRFTDSVANPVDFEGSNSQSFYVETLWPLDAGHLTFSPLESIPSVNGLPMATNSFCTFGSFSKPIKVSPSTLDFWAAVLKAVPNSRFIKSVVEETDEDKFIAALEKRGIDKSRITVLHAAKPVKEYYQRFKLIDISLDTIPGNSPAIAADSLWMGVPVITIGGKHYSSRSTSSVLAKAGFSQWIAKSTTEAVSIAKKLSRNASTLATFRDTLRESLMNSPFMDKRAQARELEKAYQAMWKVYCNKGVNGHRSSQDRKLSILQETGFAQYPIVTEGMYS